MSRIVHNAIQNIINHAKATFVNVSLTKNKEKLNLIIEDNGCGLPKNPEVKGYGITHIKERVQLLNGSVTFESPGEKGTLINIIIPLKHAKLKLWKK